MPGRCRFLSTILALLLLPAPGSAQDHLVTSEDVQARLAALAAERDENLRTVQAALLPLLTDEELRNVTARAKLLSLDPVAGANTALLIILAAIGAAVVLLLVVAAIPGSCMTDNCS